MTQTINANATETRTLEREACGRCGGSGHYSYCQMYGTTCFKCGGKKTLFTKRGAAAHEFLVRLRSKPAGELVVGDTVRHEGLMVPGAVCDKPGWAKVLEVRPGDAKLDGGALVDGVVIPPAVVVVTTRGRHGCHADTMFRVAQTKERLAETLALALAYQDTLTKAGTVHKRGAEGVAQDAARASARAAARQAAQDQKDALARDQEAAQPAPAAPAAPEAVEVEVSRTNTARYKGREYLLRWLGNTRFGRRAKLAFLDGSKEFWVAAEALEVA